MSAFDHAVWWHVYPLTACGAPIREEHTSAPRLKRLEAWMDYVVELGCNGLLMGPVFASTSHGYDTVDYYRLDPRLGTDAERPAHHAGRCVQPCGRAASVGRTPD